MNLNVHDEHIIDSKLLEDTHFCPRNENRVADRSKAERLGEREKLFPRTSLLQKGKFLGKGNTRTVHCIGKKALPSNQTNRLPLNNSFRITISRTY